MLFQFFTAFSAILFPHMLMKSQIIQLRYDADHPVIVAPEVMPEAINDDTPAEKNNSDGVAAVNREIVINSNTVSDIADEDYDTPYQLMIENALA
ncbi:hypothetical protein [Ruminococcus sp. HUN007]|uniref:hypothetical protein n=1 Tax=Ruminococcus sp. HUN007 TaxID=1514668 RepID=UPI0005D27B1B|nr:hypothetical protein [Ruminococcus sp. HUN007]